MKSLYKIFCLIICVLMITACAKLHVTSEYDKAFDFNKLKSYAWAEAGRQLSGDIRLDKNLEADPMLRQVVESELNLRGFEKVTTGSPDFLIKCEASVEREAGVKKVAYSYKSNNLQ